MKIAELATRAGVAASAVRWYEQEGVLPAPARRPNGYREYDEVDLARLRLVLSLRRLGLAPEDAGRLARLCLERGAVDLDLAPLVAEQRQGIARQRADLDRLEGELLDLEMTIAAAGRASRKERPVSADPIRVLFVCTHNSARSQIAEALLERYGGDDFEVFSAGTVVTRVNPFALRVIEEAGIDWSAARSKSITEFLDQTFDYVITVCDRARATCPVFPGSSNTLHWGLDDPSEVEGSDDEKLAAFRRTETEVVRAPPALHRGRAPRRRSAAATSARLRAIAAEFLGTFALVFFGCGAIANGLPPTSVALAFGLVIAVMIYAFGHVSGAHFNPAVSIAFGIGRHLPWSKVAAYASAQILGATIAALALRATLGPDADLGVTQPAGSDIQSFAWEVVLTFFLMVVDHGRGHGYPRGRAGRRARHRRHRGPRRARRRADQRRFDEPGALDRTRDRLGRPGPLLDLHRRSDPRRIARDARVSIRAWPSSRAER